jgi:3-oxoacyl-[acyl-carrier protein] reductase
MAYVTPGSVILVTGASGAIGFEIAAQAAAGGAIVGVHGSRAENAERAVERLRARVNDGRLVPLPADFRHEGAIDAMVAKLAREGPGLDAVIHCGITGAAGVTGVRDVD